MQIYAPSMLPVMRSVASIFHMLLDPSDDDVRSLEIVIILHEHVTVPADADGI